jgi:hypothetical protein
MFCFFALLLVCLTSTPSISVLDDVLEGVRFASKEDVRADLCCLGRECPWPGHARRPSARVDSHPTRASSLASSLLATLHLSLASRATLLPCRSQHARGRVRRLGFRSSRCCIAYSTTRRSAGLHRPQHDVLSHGAWQRAGSARRGRRLAGVGGRRGVGRCCGLAGGHAGDDAAGAGLRRAGLLRA